MMEIASCSGKGECTCVSRIIKLDPNLTMKRESLFVSSEAQSIIEELTGVSSNGRIIAKAPRATPEQERASPEELPVKQEELQEDKNQEDATQSSGNARVKSAKAKWKASEADVMKRAATPKLYYNDRTARAVMKWRTFRTNFESENQQNNELGEEDETNDTPPTEDKPSTGDGAGELENNKQPDSPVDADQPAEIPEVEDEDDELISSQRSRPGNAAYRAGPLGLPINRPPGARFGRRYSMPAVPVTTSLPPHSPTKVSPRSPGVSPRSSSPARSPSPTRHAYLSAGITHLHTNREKLSTLFNERSVVIALLDKQKAKKDLRDVKLLTSRLGRRASDSTATLSQFIQRNKVTDAPNSRLLSRRASVGTSHITRATANLSEKSSSTKKVSNLSGTPLNTHGQDAARATSKSCEDVAQQTFRHAPFPPRDRRRGSVCVGQIARAREREVPRAAPLPPRKLIETEADPTPPNYIEAKQDYDEQRGNEQIPNDVRSQCGMFIYYNQRRGSISTVNGIEDTANNKPSPREMTEKRTTSSPEGLWHGSEKDYRKKELIDINAGLLTVENVLTHNALSRYSERTDDKSLPAISPRNKPHELTDSPPSTSRPVPTVESASSPGREDSADILPTQHPIRELTPFEQPAELTSKYYALQQRRSSLFLRTESEIMEDVEQELQEQVERRKRQLMATRCVSAKGARRLQARALAQSAGGRLKRNLREVTRQRTTKELIAMDGERRRLRRETPGTFY
ncbi:uncharacterized protein [Asterias amurensis]|uniref:uncharacterized protein n=1 Tax=Asterias amurensis TaxID=7602 RepID=UPI003AB40055